MKGGAINVASLGTVVREKLRAVWSGGGIGGSESARLGRAIRRCLCLVGGGGAADGVIRPVVSEARNRSERAGPHRP